MTKNISNIIGLFRAMDKAGASDNEIDTYLEYYNLGEYLSGNKKYEGIMPSYNELDTSQQNSLLKLFNSAQKYINKTFFDKNNNIEITEDNAEGYKEIYMNYSQRDIGNGDELSEYEIKIYDVLQQNLYAYCISEGYDLNDVDYKDVDYHFVMSQLVKRNKIEKEMREKGNVVLDRLKTPYDNNLLKEAVEKRIADENIQELDADKYSVDVGNGKYDKLATQKTELCWAHASINAFDLTEEGRSLLNSNKYYDETTGIFGIHLQEAEDNGLHGGIYVITPEEIEAEGKDLSNGEGDVTVWMIAIKRYFEEMKQNPELLEKADKKGQIIMDVEEGNVKNRFFEIITGAQSSRQNLFNGTRLQIGISYGNNDILFDDISDLVSNGRGAVIIGIGGHAMSVVGIKDDKLLIQESNNSEDIGEIFFDEENNHTIFVKTEPINGKLTYEVTKYDFEHYNFNEAAIKWK